MNFDKRVSATSEGLPDPIVRVVRREDRNSIQECHEVQYQIGTE